MMEAEWLFGSQARFGDMKMLARGVEVEGLMIITPNVMIGVNPYLRDNVVIAIGIDGSMIRMILHEDDEESLVQ